MIKKIKNWFYKFLRKTQKYTGTDNIYLAKGGFWLGLGKVVTGLASLGLAIAFANLLDPNVYGNYKYILSLAEILAIFTLPGLQKATIQGVARGYEEIFYKGFKIRLKYGLIGSIAAFFIAGYYFFQGNYVLPIPFLIIGGCLPLYHASQIFSSFLTGKKLFKSSVKYNTCGRIIICGVLIFSLILLRKFELSLAFILTTLVAIYFVLQTFLGFFFYNLTKKKFHPNLKRDSNIISFGKHLTFMGVLSKVAEQLDKILIFHYLGGVETAIYAFAISPPEQLNGPKRILEELALPKFSQRKKGEIKKTIFKKLLQISAVYVILAGIYIAIAPFLYKLIFPQYTQSIFYSRIYALCLIFPGMVGTIYDSQMAVKQKYIIRIFSDISTIGLIFGLVLVYGILGIILGRLLAQFLTFSLNLFLLKKF